MMILGKPLRAQVLHFIGVGGIGMSGLAEVLAKQGATVSGSDNGSKGDFSRLEDAGVKVFRTHEAGHVPHGALVVMSTAIKPHNPELQAAQAQGLKIIHRADMLAAIMQNYQCIAVSGTHGKTSTTALTYAALRAGGVPCGIINGGVLNDIGTNAVLPPKKGDWLVVEADESDASFLKLPCAVAVITNIEPEHMETYGTEVKLVEAFTQFADQAQMAIICADDPNGQIVAMRTQTEVLTYGQEEGADSVVQSYAPQGEGMAFDATVRGGLLEDIELALPGTHYVLNALAALTAAQVAGADVVQAAEGLKTFGGVGRRFTKVGTFHGADIIDDYGHHPTEIATTIEAAKQRYGAKGGRVIAVIEPHRFSRLRDLMEDFATCAKLADVAIVMPVYSAGETPIAGITHTALAQKMESSGLPETVYAVEDEAGMHEALHELAPKAGDCILCLGAGTITIFAKQLAEHKVH
jgi:UDP-N-acetylmuramate--alanine ligase